MIRICCEHQSFVVSLLASAAMSCYGSRRRLKLQRMVAKQSFDRAGAEQDEESNSDVLQDVFIHLSDNSLPHPPRVHFHIPHFERSWPDDVQVQSKFVCFVFILLFSPKRHSRANSIVPLGKSGFDIKSRLMFPQIFLQWCTAVSSCAAKIGKLFHSPDSFVRLLCQQASCVVSLRLLQHRATPSEPWYSVQDVWTASEHHSMMYPRQKHSLLLQSTWLLLLRAS